MNMQYSPRKKISLLAATFLTVGMVMGSGTAQADRLSPAFFADELDRCAAGLRTELNTNGAARLQHTVTDIEKAGVWYVFNIRTNIIDDAGAVIGQAETRCKSHRQNERTVVDVRGQFPSGEIQLVSTD